jgi:hypothetical protein
MLRSVLAGVADAAFLATLPAILTLAIGAPLYEWRIGVTLVSELIGDAAFVAFCRD